MQTAIDRLGISSLSSLSFSTVGASAVLSGILIGNDASQTNVTFTVQPFQQAWTQIWGNQVNKGIPTPTTQDTLILVSVPSFYIGTDGNNNGYLSSFNSAPHQYLTVSSGTWRLGGKNSPAEEIYNNLIGSTLEDQKYTLIAGYSGTKIVPLSVSSSGYLNANISATISTAGLALDSSLQTLITDTINLRGTQPNPLQLAFTDIGGAGSTINISTQDINGNMLAWVDSNAASWYSWSISLTAGASGGMVWYALNTKPDGAHFITTIPSGVARINYFVKSGTFGVPTVAYNFNGRTDGAAGVTGFGADYALPTSSSAFLRFVYESEWVGR